MTLKIRERREHIRQRLDQTWVTGLGEIIPIPRMGDDHLLALAVRLEMSIYDDRIKTLYKRLEGLHGPNAFKQRVEIEKQLADLSTERRSVVSDERSLACIDAAMEAVPKYKTVRGELIKRGLVAAGETAYAASVRINRAAANVRLDALLRK
jgi:hypothetical protein